MIGIEHQLASRGLDRFKSEAHIRIYRRQISANPSVSTHYDGAVMLPARGTNFRVLGRIILERLDDAGFFPRVQISCCNLSHIATVPLVHTNKL